jgi:hypothetical protein
MSPSPEGSEIATNDEWSAAEDHDLLTLTPGEFLARHPNRTRHARRHRLDYLARLDSLEGPTTAENVAATKQKLILDAERRELKAMREDEARFQLFMDTVRAEMARMPAYDAPVLEHVVSRHGEEAAVLVISDVHVGKWVMSEEVGDSFGYSVPEFKRRLGKLREALAEIIAIHRRSIPIKRLYVLMLGDLVDGSDMRPGQKLRVDQTVGAQTLTFSREFVPFLAGLGQMFDEVRVIVVGGNHGRVGKPGENMPWDNFDVMAGHFLETALQFAPNIKVHVSHRPYEIARINGLEIYMAHGESVRGGSGLASVPTYGIAKAAARDVGLHQRLFDAYIIGHFHTAQDLDINGIPVLINGCWDGGDSYSVNQLHVASVPAQWLFGIGKRGVTWRYRLHVSESRREPSPIFDFDTDDDPAAVPAISPLDLVLPERDEEAA